MALAGAPGASEGAAAAPVVMLDLQLKSFDLRFSGSGGSSPAGAGGGSSERSASPTSAGRSAAASAVAGGLAALEARVSCGATSVSVHSMLDGLAVKVRGGGRAWPAGAAWWLHGGPLHGVHLSRAGVAAGVKPPVLCSGG